MTANNTEPASESPEPGSNSPEPGSNSTEPGSKNTACGLKTAESANIAETANPSESNPKTIVVKIGTSSLTEGLGLQLQAIDKLIGEIHELRQSQHSVVLVSSAAIAAGMAKLGYSEKPRDFESLQALSAVGQIELMRAYDQVCGEYGFTCGQVLVAPPDFFERGRYLRARSCIESQLKLGVLPVINENDAVADDAIRFGDNDRIAAMVAQLLHADMLVLLTDTEGLLTADPRIDETATLIEEIVEVDTELLAKAGGTGTSLSSGGMASKLSAAHIASWSGVETVICNAKRENVLRDALSAQSSVGTRFQPRQTNLTARKLWIAFAVAAEGRVHVDAGAKRALEASGASLLSVGVTKIVGQFDEGAAVELVDPKGEVFAKGIASASAPRLRASIGDRGTEVIHRDHLVVLPANSPEPLKPAITPAS